MEKFSCVLGVISVHLPQMKCVMIRGSLNLGLQTEDKMLKDEEKNGFICKNQNADVAAVRLTNIDSVLHTMRNKPQINNTMPN